MMFRSRCLVGCLMLLISLAACATPVARSAFEPDTVATRWIRAIERRDWPAMGEMLADDAVYEDATMRYFERDPIKLIGPREIVDFWTRSSAESGTSKIVYRLLDRFETGGITVLHLHLEAEVAGEFWGVDQPTIVLSGRVTTVLTVDDGRIVHVHDLVDYRSMMDQVERLQAVVRLP